MFAELLCGTVALVLYVNTLGADFCYDDRERQGCGESQLLLHNHAPSNFSKVDAGLRWPTCTDEDSASLSVPVTASSLAPCVSVLIWNPTLVASIRVSPSAPCNYRPARREDSRHGLVDATAPLSLHLALSLVFGCLLFLSTTPQSLSGRHLPAANDCLQMVPFPVRRCSYCGIGSRSPAVAVSSLCSSQATASRFKAELIRL
ncbi:unnamed protein product [Pleuronectes platessa]|uniref:Secreted protein n=1 Tax=Pleuronectes platessa TaxID=8262 RepID=A0A9N7YER2_PLEPL|nr:unnamed protein product [Pleuronectes platessa]